MKIGRKSITKTVKVAGVNILIHADKNYRVCDIYTLEDKKQAKRLTGVLSVVQGRQYNSLETIERIINLTKELFNA